MIVPLHSVAWFDFIAKAVWNKEFSKQPPRPDENTKYGCNETLLQLQDLMSGLISNCPLFNIEKDEPESDEGNQTSDESRCAIDITYEAVQKNVDQMSDPRAHSDSRRIPIDPAPADPIVVLMMAGAIFGFIFSFLLSKCTPLQLLLNKSICEVADKIYNIVIQACHLPTSAEKVAEMGTIQFVNFQERLLFTLLAYMGLSTSSFSWGRPDRPTNATSSPPSTLSMSDSHDFTNTPTTQDNTPPSK
jgi:hypothetical protein